MKRILLALVLLGAFVGGPSYAQQAQPTAQSAPTLTSASVSLWPEYDKPEMLVIFSGQFAADVPLPVAAELRIPASVGQPSALAYVDDEGQLLSVEYTTRTEGDWLIASFSLPTARFQLEYYAPLVVEGDQRTFVYTYTADYAVTAFSLEAQVPPTAQEFALDPAADSVTQEADGLTYHLVNAASLAPDETLSWTETYRKPDASLTVDALKPTPASIAEAATGDQAGSNTTVIIFLVAFVALFAVGAGAFWLGRRVQPAAQGEGDARREARRGAGRRVAPGLSTPSPRDDSLFCHTCGTRLRPDADFCHKCGAAVRGRET